MADVNCMPGWNKEVTQCKNCKLFQGKDNKYAYVSFNKDFDSVLKEFGSEQYPRATVTIS